MEPNNLNAGNEGSLPPGPAPVVSPLGASENPPPLGQAASEELASNLDDSDDEIQDERDDAAPLEFVDESAEPAAEKKWYILKVQSNREDSIKDALLRRVKVAGLESYFGEVIVPTEDVAEYREGKRRVVKRKLYPGYIVAYMAITDESWFVVRETPGIGDFTGSAGRPAPISQFEIDKILRKAKPDTAEGAPVKSNIPFKKGERIRVKDGNFLNFEGEVSAIDEANGRVTVMIQIFGRATPVEFEHWQLESI